MGDNNKKGYNYEQPYYNAKNKEFENFDRWAKNPIFQQTNSALFPFGKTSNRSTARKKESNFF